MIVRPRYSSSLQNMIEVRLPCTLCVLHCSILDPGSVGSTRHAGFRGV